MEKAKEGPKRKNFEYNFVVCYKSVNFAENIINKSAMERLGRIMLLAAMLLSTVIAKAQFTVVDADTKESLPGVYVFSETGTLLAMSDENGQVKEQTGKVMLSMISYETKTIDATGLKGEVELKGKPFELGEVVVGRTEYLKISAAFRDVVKNYDNLVVFREGLVDYYYNAKTKKYKRYIRACRQYEHPELRNTMAHDSLAMMLLPVLDFNKVKRVTTLSETTSGDTTVVEAKYGKKIVKDGMMTIEKNGTYRDIVDALKFLDRTSVSFLGLRYTLTKHITDWQFSEKTEHMDATSLISCRDYREEEYQWSKKSPIVPITTTSDLVVYSVTNLKTQEARVEMKDKEMTADFTLPECLPTVPESVLEHVAKKLVLKKFRER